MLRADLGLATTEMAQLPLREEPEVRDAGPVRMGRRARPTKVGREDPVWAVPREQTVGAGVPVLMEAPEEAAAEHLGVAEEKTVTRQKAAEEAAGAPGK